jgi:peptidoglycan/LPS O-acetylase OafA/YrhL
MRRIAGFDGVRALAAVAVVCAHLHLLTGITDRRLATMLGGFRAVHLFFALSGFLITALLIRERENFGRVSIRAFYARRAFRILPLYLICLGVVGLLRLVLGHGVSGKELLYAATYTYNFMLRDDIGPQLMHTWSLAVEEHFYLIWPVVFCLFYSRRERGLVQGCVLIVLLAIFTHTLQGAMTHRFYVLSYWSCFAGMTILMGCVVAMLSCDDTYRERAAPYLRSRGALLLSVVLWAHPYLPLRSLGVFPNYLHGLGCALIVGWIYHNQQSVLVRLLDCRPLRYLGTTSYGIYMYQGVLLTSSPVRIPGQVWPLPLWAGCAVLCIVVPLSYHFIERPLIARGKQFRQRPIVVDAGPGHSHADLRANPGQLRSVPEAVPPGR